MDAVVPHGAALRHHDQATFATAERREATHTPRAEQGHRCQATEGCAVRAVAIDADESNRRLRALNLAIVAGEAQYEGHRYGRRTG
jgi:hypothetical protein